MDSRKSVFLLISNGTLGNEINSAERIIYK